MVRLMSGGKEGDVLIPTFSRRTPLAEREAFARSIASSEELTTVNLYCSREAQKANVSERYSRAHPSALKTCYLGMLKDGRFYDSRF